MSLTERGKLQGMERPAQISDIGSKRKLWRPKALFTRIALCAFCDPYQFSFSLTIHLLRDMRSKTESNRNPSQSDEAEKPEQLVEARTEEEVEAQVQAQTQQKDIDYITGMQLNLLIFVCATIMLSQKAFTYRALAVCYASFSRILRSPS